ncbi:MAG TPA: hypothetical protein VL175_01900, partial [Pirellulales bacterium]|nr:hypothetical protein [Pirellulales bacterium]
LHEDAITALVFTRFVPIFGGYEWQLFIPLHAPDPLARQIAASARFGNGCTAMTLRLGKASSKFQFVALHDRQSRRVTRDANQSLERLTSSG